MIPDNGFLLTRFLLIIDSTIQSQIESPEASSPFIGSNRIPESGVQQQQQLFSLHQELFFDPIESLPSVLLEDPNNNNNTNNYNYNYETGYSFLNDADENNINNSNNNNNTTFLLDNNHDNTSNTFYPSNGNLFYPRGNLVCWIYSDAHYFSLQLRPTSTVAQLVQQIYQSFPKAISGIFFRTNGELQMLPPHCYTSEWGLSNFAEKIAEDEYKLVVLVKEDTSLTPRFWWMVVRWMTENQYQPFYIYPSLQ